MSDAIEKQAAEKPAVEKSSKKQLKQYKITFHGEGGDIEIGHNFKLNLYKRNVETTIDENFLAVVKDAVIHTVVKDEDGKERKATIPAYQYTVEPV
jgi:hypothetical protein